MGQLQVQMGTEGKGLTLKTDHRGSLVLTDL